MNCAGRFHQAVEETPVILNDLVGFEPKKHTTIYNAAQEELEEEAGLAVLEVRMGKGEVANPRPR
jgi:hypothetical protein